MSFRRAAQVSSSKLGAVGEPEAVHRPRFQVQTAATPDSLARRSRLLRQKRLTFTLPAAAQRQHLVVAQSKSAVILALKRLRAADLVGVGPELNVQRLTLLWPAAAAAAELARHHLTVKVVRAVGTMQ